jgi:hypothetical protein
MQFHARRAAMLQMKKPFTSFVQNLGNEPDSWGDSHWLLATTSSIHAPIMCSNAAPAAWRLILASRCKALSGAAALGLPCGCPVLLWDACMHQGVHANH